MIAIDVAVLSEITENSVQLPFVCCRQTSPEHPGPKDCHCSGVFLALAGALDRAASVIVSSLRLGGVFCCHLLFVHLRKMKELSMHQN